MGINGENKLHHIEVSDQNVSDIYVFFKFCNDNKNLIEKCGKISDLWSQCVSCFGGLQEDRNLVFAKKIAEFEELLKKYQSKKNIDAFQKAFDQIFVKKLYKPYRKILGATKSLVGYIINRDKNNLFNGYRHVVGQNIYETLKPNTENLNKLNTQIQEQINTTLINSTNDIELDDEELDNADYNDDTYLIPISILENKLASLIQMNPYNNNERKKQIDKMINKFRLEEGKNYGEEEMDIIISSFLSKNSNYL